MSVLTLLGCVGIGLVWGWLLGSLEGRIRRLRQTMPLLALANLVLIFEVRWFVKWPGIVFFGATSALTFLLHVGWRRHLRRRFEVFHSK